MKAHIILLSLLFLLPAGLLRAQDIKGSKDHPLLSRYPGSYISYYEEVKYREYNFASGPVTGYRQIKESRIIPAQLHRLTYFIDKSVEELSIGEIYQDYVQALKKAKIDILSQGLFPQRNVNKEVGGMTWIGLALGNNPFPGNTAANDMFRGTSSSGGSFAIVGKVQRAEGATYLALYAKRFSKNRVICHLDVIEAKEAETGLVTADAAYLSREIEQYGKVALYGIYFDFDKAIVKEESKAALEEIAKLLKSKSDLNLYVVGHTDMKGELVYNLKLSEDRAQAVVDKLVEVYGINRSRLEAKGVGPLVPVLSNQAEAGRSQNRRVELVEK